MASSLTDFDLVTKSALYKVMDPEYDAAEVGYPDLFDVQTTDLPIYGLKGTSMAGLDRPSWRRDGERIKQGQTGEGYPWQIALRLLSKQMRFPERHAESLMAAGGMAAAIARGGAGWGESFALECDDMVAHVYQKGTLTAGLGNYKGEPFNQHYRGEDDPYPGLGYDGVPLFDDAHPLKYAPGVTLSNINPTRSLTYANLQSSYTQFSDTCAYDERNDRIRIRPTHLVVGPALTFTAASILGSPGNPGSANLEANVLRGTLQPYTWRALSDDSDAWWLQTRGKGIKVLDSGRPQIRTWFDEETREYCVSAEKRFGVGWTQWRFSQCNNKAAS